MYVVDSQIHENFKKSRIIQISALIGDSAILFLIRHSLQYFFNEHKIWIRDHKVKSNEEKKGGGREFYAILP